MRLEFSASIELGEISRRTRFAAISALFTAALVALASLAGIAAPATYARETALWRTEGIAQDWADLVVDVPWLVASALLVLRGSRRARLLLGGALLYTAYAFVLYAFDIHFNALFLVYCGALGLSAYGLAALAPELRGARAWLDDRAPRRFAGGLAMICAGVFALLWLSQIVPALVRGTTPGELEASGLPSNPVHVLDLALVLPAMFAGGWLLWHDRSLGYAVVPVMLAFTVLMSAALVAMAVALATPALAIGAGALAVLAAIALAWLLVPSRALAHAH